MLCCPNFPVPTVVPGPQGLAGATGSTGATGATGPAGPPGLTWMGVWNFVTAYSVNDVVSYNNADWYCLYPNTNVIPSLSSPYWSQLVFGAPGPSGATGVISRNEAHNGSLSYNLTTSLANIGAQTSTLAFGKYLIFARVRIDCAAASWMSAPTVTLELFDNGAIAAIPNTSRTFVLSNYTTVTGTVIDVTLPVVFYDATGDGDAPLFAIYGEISATPSSGTIKVIEADLTAVQINT